MWKEIKLNDSTGITNFIGVQKSCSEYYNSTWTELKITTKFSKGDGYFLRAFIYSDKDYEINLAVCNPYVLRVADKSTMVLNTVGIGKHKDIDGAVKIVMQKISALSIEYKVDKIIAGWGDDVYPHVQEFYQGMAKAFTSVGFSKVKLDFDQESGVYLINVER